MCFYIRFISLKRCYSALFTILNHKRFVEFATYRHRNVPSSLSIYRYDSSMRVRPIYFDQQSHRSVTLESSLAYRHFSLCAIVHFRSLQNRFSIFCNRVKSLQPECVQTVRERANPTNDLIPFFLDKHRNAWNLDGYLYATIYRYPYTLVTIWIREVITDYANI